MVPPESAGVVRRFFGGFALPFRLFAKAWRAPAFRTQLIGPLLVQCLVLAVAVAWSLGEWVDTSRRHHRIDTDLQGVQLQLDAGVGGLLGFISAVEWWLVLVFRGYHLHVEQAACAATGVRFDGGTVPARAVGLHVGWAARRVKRTLQGMLVMLVSMLPLVAITLAIAFTALGLLEKTPFRDALSTGVDRGLKLAVTALGLYWTSVLTLGRSGYSFAPTNAVPGWLARLRRWRWLSPWRWLLEKAMGLLTRPAARREGLRAEVWGLVAARAIISLPFVYLALRPIVPLAATALLDARGELPPQPTVAVSPAPESTSAS